MRLLSSAMHDERISLPLFSVLQTLKLNNISLQSGLMAESSSLRLASSSLDQKGILTLFAIHARLKRPLHLGSQWWHDALGPALSQIPLPDLISLLQRCHANNILLPQQALNEYGLAIESYLSHLTISPNESIPPLQSSRDLTLHLLRLLVVFARLRQYPSYSTMNAILFTMLKAGGGSLHHLDSIHLAASIRALALLQFVPTMGARTWLNIFVNECIQRAPSFTREEAAVILWSFAVLDSSPWRTHLHSKAFEDLLRAVREMDTWISASMIILPGRRRRASPLRPYSKPFRGFSALHVRVALWALTQFQTRVPKT